MTRVSTPPLPSSSATNALQFFMPPYVAHLGWIGVRLDRDLGWDEIEGVIRNAHEVVAQKMTGQRRSVTLPRAPAAKARRST